MHAKTKKFIFWTAVAIIVVVGGIYIKNNFFTADDPQKLADAEKAKAVANPTPENIAWAKSAQETADASKNVAPGFPLKVGSRGDYVKALQQAMIKKYGNVLPRYGADGIFGAETDKAVRDNLGGDGTVTVLMYNVLLNDTK